MKVGIYSDVHGNLEALEAVLAALVHEDVGTTWCLGDLVGYGANPNECVARVRATAGATVRGNHDAACTGLEDPSAFNRWAREACEWTARQLTEDNRDWLRALPLSASVGDVLLVHASPFEPSAWHYMLHVSDMLSGFSSLEQPVAFIGHSHQQVILVNRGDEFFRAERHHVAFDEDCRYIINVGSAGQPRDGNPLASYAVYDTDARKVWLKRVPYDVATAQKKIREAGLPEILAQRLEYGN